MCIYMSVCLCLFLCMCVHLRVSVMTQNHLNRPLTVSTFKKTICSSVVRKNLPIRCISFRAFSEKDLPSFAKLSFNWQDLVPASSSCLFLYTHFFSFFLLSGFTTTILKLKILLLFKAFYIISARFLAQFSKTHDRTKRYITVWKCTATNSVLSEMGWQIYSW